MRRQQEDEVEDPQWRAINKLSSLLFNLLQSHIPFGDQGRRRTTRGVADITPAGLAYMMLGVSVALMLCGSVTFFIGFLMIPWVIGLVMVLYLAGIVSAVSLLGKSLICYALPPPPPPPPPPPLFPTTSPRKGVNNVSAWKLL